MRCCIPVALGMLLTCCGKADKPGAGPAVDAGRVARGLVVARVGKSSITVGEMEDALNDLHPSIRVRFSSPERRKEFLKNMVRFEVLAREARRRGLDRDPEVIKRVKRAMIDVMMNKLRSSLVAMEDISAADVERYYNEHIERYRRPPRARASAIIVGTRQEAAKLIARLKQEGGGVKHFGELAAKHSVDPATKVRRGDLGFFARDDGKVNAKLREAAFAMDTLWSVGGPVKTDRGWAVLMKTGEAEGVNKPLERERDRIKNRLFNERRLQAVEEFVKQLQAKAKVEILEKNLAKVEVTQAPAPPTPTKPGVDR